MTTMAVRNEGKLKEILNLPEDYAIASIVALGHPESRHTKLKRRSVEEFTTVDRFSGPPFSA